MTESVVLPATMRAWTVERPGPLESRPLRLVERPVPAPGPGELLVRVSACGVCRTDLHVAMGDLAVHRVGVVPGHEVVGRVVALGPPPPGNDQPGNDPPDNDQPDSDPPDRDPPGINLGDRVGIAWLRRTCGRCRFCVSHRENLCLTPEFTGWDADGGYAEYAVVPAAYAYRLPPVFDDVAAAPLLCAGIIGYRALERAQLPEGGRLGIYGFGGSAHLTAQLALARGATVHVMTRSASARALARELGAASAQAADHPPPEPLDAAILFAPVGDLVPPALAALDRGGTLVVAGIHLSDIPGLDYQEHLFQERQLRSVTANTRADGAAFLAEAAACGLRVHTVPYPFEQADRALVDLWEDRVDGAAVLTRA